MCVGVWNDRRLRPGNAGVTLRGMLDKPIREPITVKEIDETARQAERAWARLREAVRGTPVDTVEQARNFGAGVSKRLGTFTSQERQALLFLFAIDRLTGRSNEAGVVDIDDDVAARLGVDRADG